MKIVAITACVTGMAHTWMAEKALTAYAKDHNFDIKVETQSAMGCENKLTKKDIAEADAVIFAADITVSEPERFEGCKIIKVIPGYAIRETDKLFERINELIQQN